MVNTSFCFIDSLFEPVISIADLLDVNNISVDLLVTNKFISDLLLLSKLFIIVQKECEVRYVSEKIR